MNAQETLFTERLKLRPLKASDASAICDYFSLDEVVKYYDLPKFTSIDQAEDLVKRWMIRRETNEGERWAITSKNDDLCIGTMGFVDISERNNSAGVGYELHPNQWNKGFASELLKEIIRYGFQERSFHRIWAMTDPKNKASQQVLIKNGLLYEGTMRESTFEKGMYVDESIFSILLRDWEAP